MVQEAIASAAGAEEARGSVYVDAWFTDAAPLIVSVGATLLTVTDRVLELYVPLGLVAVALTAYVLGPSANVWVTDEGLPETTWTLPSPHVIDHDVIVSAPWPVADRLRV